MGLSAEDRNPRRRQSVGVNQKRLCANRPGVVHRKVWQCTPVTYALDAHPLPRGSGVRVVNFSSFRNRKR